MKFLWILGLILLCSCSETEKECITRLVKNFEGKEIKFPKNRVYTIYGTDTVNYTPPISDYTIVYYVDSVGCTSCKLQLAYWLGYMHEMDSLFPGRVSYQFIFHPKNKRELSYLLKQDNFDFPVWMSSDNQFYLLNQLPKDRIFHTMLLNRFNRVVALGNPISNFKIKELYKKIILNKEYDTVEQMQMLTTVSLNKKGIDFGNFNWHLEQKDTIQLLNQGKNPLIINDMVSSCGCIKLDYSRKPIMPGEKLHLIVSYKADKPEYFNKVVKVYANTNEKLEFSVRGYSNNE